ncbi:MAG: cupin domain-containing protein [Planctomycetaceae bacterium]|nr:MAG: cupin domain-containing protein [Planctomycetaceae bacterium]
MERYKVDFGSMPWEQPAPGVRFKAYEQDGRRLRLAQFTKDFVEADWCTRGHAGYVLEGKLEVDFHGQVVTLSPGDGLFIRPGHEHRHKARVLTDFVRVVLVEDV